MKNRSSSETFKERPLVWMWEAEVREKERKTEGHWEPADHGASSHQLTNGQFDSNQYARWKRIWLFFLLNFAHSMLLTRGGGEQDKGLKRSASSLANGKGAGQKASESAGRETEVWADRKVTTQFGTNEKGWTAMRKSHQGARIFIHSSPVLYWPRAHRL